MKTDISNFKVDAEIFEKICSTILCSVGSAAFKGGALSMRALAKKEANPRLKDEDISRETKEQMDGVICEEYMNARQEIYKLLGGKIKQ